MGKSQTGNANISIFCYRIWNFISGKLMPMSWNFTWANKNWKNPTGRHFYYRPLNTVIYGYTLPTGKYYTKFPLLMLQLLGNAASQGRGWNSEEEQARERRDGQEACVRIWRRRRSGRWPAGLRDPARVSKFTIKSAQTWHLCASFESTHEHFATDPGRTPRSATRKTRSPSSTRWVGGTSD